MSRHLSSDRLSAYLDHELGGSETEVLETHLEGCADCQTRLGSLRRVVGHLQRIESLTPPPLMAGEVARRIALERRPRGLVERLETSLGGTRFDSPLLVGFTLVCALAAILYSFARGVDRHQRRNIPIVVAPPGVSAEYPEPGGGTAEVREIDGRQFELREGVWWEKGLGENATVTPVEAQDPRHAEIRAAIPGLEDLLDRPVVLNFEGETVRLELSMP